VELNEFAPNVYEDDEELVEPVTAEQLFSNPVAGEVPTMHAEIKLVTGLEAAIEDLELLLTDIRQAGGMCAGFAIEGRRLVDGFDGGALPGYYTAHPSQTRLRTSLESITETIRNYAKKILDAIRGFIDKIVNWVLGWRNSHKAPTEKDLEAAAKHDTEDFEARKEMIDEIAPITIELKGFVAGGLNVRFGDYVKQYNDANALILDAYNESRPGSFEAIRFLTNPDPVLDDILSGGEYSKAIGTMAENAVQALAQLEAKTAIIRQILITDVTGSSVSSEIVSRQMLSKIKDETRVKYHGKIMTLAEIAKEVRAVQDKVANQKELTVPRQFAEVFEQLARAIDEGPARKSIESFHAITAAMFRVRQTLSQVIDIIGNPRTDNEAGAPRGDLGPVLREVTAAMQDELSTLQEIIGLLDRYNNAFNRTCDQARGFATRAANRIYTMVSQNAEAPQEGVMLMKIAKLMGDIESRKHVLHFDRMIMAKQGL